ncbi:hypothetical protein EDEG_01353 [Edhazardia aedis USNM 41457]|uniref:Uncharacterized protein n=1 Tax=Edhazardia aedis (strain USNM 41457) TaxID=1003232 RepID=J9DSX1_EDHAE|nr:hypothetical protein EDEG_01353 [Edhazardia aedis USNM 41457]|eukprot:EJW04417.1 hypothetical protein EDEG_01353 [Edhazardia aedis USNM 41457]
MKNNKNIDSSINKNNININNDSIMNINNTIGNFDAINNMQNDTDNIQSSSLLNNNPKNIYSIYYNDMSNFNINNNKTCCNNTMKNNSFTLLDDKLLKDIDFKHNIDKGNTNVENQNTLKFKGNMYNQNNLDKYNTQQSFYALDATNSSINHKVVQGSLNHCNLYDISLNQKNTNSSNNHNQIIDQNTFFIQHESNINNKNIYSFNNSNKNRNLYTNSSKNNKDIPNLEINEFYKSISQINSSQHQENCSSNINNTDNFKFNIQPLNDTASFIIKELNTVKSISEIPFLKNNENSIFSSEISFTTPKMDKHSQNNGQNGVIDEFKEFDEFENIEENKVETKEINNIKDSKEFQKTDDMNLKAYEIQNDFEEIDQNLCNDILDIVIAENKCSSKKDINNSSININIVNTSITDTTVDYTIENSNSMKHNINKVNTNNEKKEDMALIDTSTPPDNLNKNDIASAIIAEKDCDKTNCDNIHNVLGDNKNEDILEEKDNNTSIYCNNAVLDGKINTNIRNSEKHEIEKNHNDNINSQLALPHNNILPANRLSSYNKSSITSKTKDKQKSLIYTENNDENNEKNTSKKDFQSADTTKQNKRRNTFANDKTTPSKRRKRRSLNMPKTFK